MRLHLTFILIAPFVVACSSTEGSGSSGNTGGSGGSQGGSAGAVAVGGGGASASAGQGGASGSGASGGGGGGSAGQGGSAIAGGGAGGASGGGGGTGGGVGVVVPSQGCGLGGRPANGEVSVDNDRIYDFPETYDGSTPFPLVIALHGANNSNTILQILSDGSRLETEFVRAFPKSNGSAWSFSGGTGPDSQRISDIYDELLAEYCIDTSRVFLTGHSSGAQMSVQMMCVPGGDPRFKAVAPVSASHYCDTLTPVPVLYIQGQMDAQRGDSDGADVVAVFQQSNGCMDSSTPYAAIQGCNSELNGDPVDPGCIEYQGCTEPTVWCSHNDPNYNLAEGFQHGWPCFASDGIADFFLSLP